MDERSVSRIVTDEAVRGHRAGRAFDARMYNLSTTGCAVECPAELLARGDRVVIAVEDLLSVEGAVAWELDGRAGVRFDDPLHADVVMYLGFRKEVGLTAEDVASDAGRFAKPGIPALVTLEERPAAR